MFQYGLNILAIIIAYCYFFGFIYGILYLIPSIFVFDMIIAKFGYQRVLDMDLVMNFLSSQWNTNITVYMEIEKISFEMFRDKVHTRIITAVPS